MEFSPGGEGREGGLILANLLKAQSKEALLKQQTNRGRRAVIVP
jgi:hypothetical protein